MEAKLEYAKEEDLKEISDLFIKILFSLPYYNDLAKEKEKAKYTEKELAQKIKEDRYSVLVAKDQTSLVGFCFSRFDEGTVWLEWFCVSPSHRGTNIGNKILKKLEESVRIRGCHKIWCDSRTENIASFKSLLRNGYTLVTTLKNHWFNQDFFIWKKFMS